MSTVLHLLGPGVEPVHAAEAADAIAAEARGEGATPRPATADDDAPGGVHRVVTLGPAAAAAAARAGLRVDAALHPPGLAAGAARVPFTARASLRRRLPAVTGGAEGAAGEPPAAVVAWDASALAVASAFLLRTPRVLRLGELPPPGEQVRLGALMASSGFDLAAAGEALREALVAAGLPAGRVRVHPPSLDASRLPAAGADGSGESGESGESGGSGGDAAGPLRFAVAGGPGVDARPLVLAAALAQEAGGRRIELRLSPSAHRLAEALDVADAAETSAGGGPRVTQDPAVETPWRGFHEVDAALLPVGAPAHAARWAALAGVPRVFMQPQTSFGLDPGEARETDRVSRHPLPRDLAAAMTGVAAPPRAGGASEEERE